MPCLEGFLTNAGLWPSLAFYAFPNDVLPPFFPEVLWIVLTYVGAALAVVLMMNLVMRVVQAFRKSGEPLARLRSIEPARALTYLTFLALLGLVLVYPLFVERYFLPLLPGAIILLLEATHPRRPSWVLATVALLAVGV